MIRFWTQGEPEAEPDAPPASATWSDIGYTYLLGMIDSGLDFFAVASTPIDYRGNRWEALLPHFTTPFIRRPIDINVVCGFGSDLERLWTGGTVMSSLNVAITGCHPRLLNGGDLEALKKYQHVIAVNRVSEVFLETMGIKSTWVKPSGVELAAFFGAIL